MDELEIELRGRRRDILTLHVGSNLHGRMCNRLS